MSSPELNNFLIRNSPSFEEQFPGVKVDFASERHQEIIRESFRNGIQTIKFIEVVYDKTESEVGNVLREALLAFKYYPIGVNENRKQYKKRIESLMAEMLKDEFSSSFTSNGVVYKLKPTIMVVNNGYAFVSNFEYTQTLEEDSRLISYNGEQLFTFIKDDMFGSGRCFFNYREDYARFGIRFDPMDDIDKVVIIDDKKSDRKVNEIRAIANFILFVMLSAVLFVYLGLH